MTELNWIVSRGENRYPVSDLETLRSWVTSGNVLATDNIWNPQRGVWAAARETPEIADLLVRPTPLPVVAGASAVAVSTPGATPVPVAAGQRAVAYVVDVLPAVVMVVLLSLIPLIGHVAAGILLGCYWLFRDAEGFSLGKRALKLRILSADGAMPTKQQLIRRNLPLGIAGFCLAVPLIGLAIGPVAGFIAVVANAILILTEQRSLGDRIAGTVVVQG